MTVRTHNAPEVAALLVALANTAEQIDCCLDRRDRRAFRVWVKRHASLTARLSSLLLRIATTSEV